MAKNKGAGGKKKPKKGITLAAPPPPAQRPDTAPIREVGAAPLALVAAAGTLTEFRRLADNVPVVVNRKHTRVLADPLDYYLHRGVIDNDAWTAGERLRRQHYHAFGSGLTSVNLDGFHGVANYADNWRITTTQGDSLREYIRTMKMFSLAQREMLESVCCRSEYAKTAARRCGVPPKKGIDLLRESLGLLSTYYRTGRRPDMQDLGQR